MSEEPYSHDRHDAMPAGETFPPDLEALADRLRADGAFWHSGLPDPARVAARIRAIPLLAPQGEPQGDSPVSIQYTPPPDYTEPTFPPARQLPPHAPRRPRAGIFAPLAAVLVVALLVAVFVQVAQRGGNPTGPIAHPTLTPGHPTQTQPTVQPSVQPTATTHLVLVYFSKKPDSYNDPTAVFPVQRTAPTAAVGTYAIQQLIAGPTASEASAGYFTELTAALSGSSSCGGADFTLTLNKRGARPESGTATLQFCRALTLPGEQTDGRIKAEITRTLTQFDTIHMAVILTRDGHCFADLSGADRCLQPST
jgi:Sporulation and spore germination